MANIEGEFLARSRQISYPFADCNLRIKVNSIETELKTTDLIVDGFITHRVPGASSILLPGETWRVAQLTTPAAAEPLELTVKTSISGTPLAIPYDTAASVDTGARGYWILVYAAEASELIIWLLVDKTGALYESTKDNDTAWEFFDSDLLTTAPVFAGRSSDHYRPVLENGFLMPGSTQWNDSAGELGIIAGANIDITIDPVSSRAAALVPRDTINRPPVTRVVIKAAVGAGTGRNPSDCVGAPGIYSINNIRGHKRNIQLVGDSCYHIWRGPGVPPAIGSLTIRNDCLACCDCVDFVDVLERIRQLKDIGLATKALWEGTLAIYQEFVELLNERLACQGIGCFSLFSAYAFTGWAVTAYVYIGNPQPCAKSGASASVTILGGDYAPMLIPGSGMVYTQSGQFIQIDPEVAGSTFSISDNASMPSGSYKMFTFSVRMQESADRVAGNTVLLTATVSACGDVPVTHQEAVMLLGPITRT